MLTISRPPCFLLIIVSTVLFHPMVHAGGPPANDHCTGATAIPCGGTFVVNNVDSTPPQNDGGPGDSELPPGSPSCQWDNTPTDVHHTLWYSFIATATSVKVETCPTTQVSDTIIALYVGTCGNLTQLACGEDGCGSTGYLSTFCYSGLVPGNTYRLMVGMPGSFPGFVPGDIALEMSCPCSGVNPGGNSGLTFVDQTSTRLVANPTVGAADTQEKDYAWGDVDLDGDVDLVSVRKEPFNTPGRFRNVLFMNEGMAEGHATDGVLVDRTLEFASEADDGGQGFLDLTNDRDVALVDVNGDNWLDIVTSTTYGQGLPKTISHPRVYRNKGEIGGVWQGYRYEESRTPTMPIAPHFCGVGVGDVTGDGAPDLYFVDYNNTLEDRLWINDGTGVFVDESTSRLTAEMRESDFGVHAVIADLNGDGVNDIIKDRGSTASTPPLRITTSYNSPTNEGFFNTFDVVYNGSPYHVAVGDLNNDTRPDIIVEDDGTDRYFLNQGNGGDGLANFLGFNFSNVSDSFGGNIHLSDLDDDGFDDVLISDVDVDCCGCTRHMRMWRNRGDVPNVTFEELSGAIPTSARTGTHDVAVFDINRDSRLDLVIGTCTGTSVWIQQQPSGIDFSYPQGIPEIVPPNQQVSFQVLMQPTSGSTIVPGSAVLFRSINGGSYTSNPMMNSGGNLYTATLPALTCLSRVEFYVRAQLSNGLFFLDPPNPASDAYEAIAARRTTLLLADDFENTAPSWAVSSDPSLTSGEWHRAEPNGAIWNGMLVAPEGDATPGVGYRALVTENGPPNGSPFDHDVDGGPTTLTSPVINLAGADGIISYATWVFSGAGARGQEDSLFVEVSNNGVNWVSVRTVMNTNGVWERASFRVGSYVAPNANVRMRLRIADNPNNTITEAGFDDFKVEKLICVGCSNPADCDDGNICTMNVCTAGDCTFPPVANGVSCADSDACNGLETCQGGQCAAGSPMPCDDGNPCTSNGCAAGACVFNPLADGQPCVDELFCTAHETCQGGSCVSGGATCPIGQTCDEASDICIDTSPQLQPKMGDPLRDLTASELVRFLSGKTAFRRVMEVDDGLGPIFNQNSCGSCHNTPTGGSGTVRVIRFGVAGGKSVDGMFDSLEQWGGSLLQESANTPACAEQIPSEANITAQRLTNSTLGFGLVEAIPDEQILAHADPNDFNGDGVSNRAHIVPILEGAPGETGVGRFGWKSQLATVLSFSADAALQEMGITNRILPMENDPNGINPPALAGCDTVPDPEDDGPIGNAFIDQVTDFQRFLAPPPQTPKSGTTGEALFVDIGCAKCHLASAFVTADDPGLELAIRNKPLKPYTDFLLHDMGLLGDGIAQGDAQEREMRTVPLWGLRVRDPLLHDGRAGAGTFESRIFKAVAWHCAIGSEAQSSAHLFLNGLDLSIECPDCPTECTDPTPGGLSGAQRTSVLTFLDSLGRREFDHNGDGSVTTEDFTGVGPPGTNFVSCYGTGPYEPDHPCAVSDIDQSEDVDLVDFQFFVSAFDDALPDCDGNGINDFEEILNGAADTDKNGLLDVCTGEIPAVGGVGLAIMALLLGAGGAILVSRRRTSGVIH